MIPQLAYSPEATLCRIRAEYWEMPGLKLTLEQARRLWALDLDACGRLLTELVTAGFLSRTLDGAFMRRDGRSVR